jgi:hypothetical protein
VYVSAGQLVGIEKTALRDCRFSGGTATPMLECSCTRTLMSPDSTKIAVSPTNLLFFITGPSGNFFKSPATGVLNLFQLFLPNHGEP